MRGFRGLKKCELFDRVWGVRPIHALYNLQTGAALDTNHFPYQRFNNAVIVPVKLAPYARSMAGVPEGAIPPGEQDGWGAILAPVVGMALSGYWPTDAGYPAFALDSIPHGSRAVCGFFCC